MTKNVPCTVLYQYQNKKSLRCRIYSIPYMNSYAESWVGTIKRECLNHFIVFGERHLRYLISEYVKHYNEYRPHSAMNNMPLKKTEFNKGNTGKINSQSKLGGIIKQYYRG